MVKDPPTRKSSPWKAEKDCRCDGGSVPSRCGFPSRCSLRYMMLISMAPRGSQGPPGDAIPVSVSDSLPSFLLSHHLAGPGAKNVPLVVPSWHWAHWGKADTRWHYHPFQGRCSWLSFSIVNYPSARGHILVAVSRWVLKNLSI